MNALRAVAAVFIAVAAAAGAAAWWLSAPVMLSAADLPAHAPDLANGARLFDAGGCAACHAAPGVDGDERLKLGGGLELRTAFGIFRVPNISPDRDTGIGGWTEADFVNAMVNGVGPGGVHLYPAFPYPSYSRMTLADIIDLKGFLNGLPAVSRRVAGPDLAFPYSVRRGIGLWKLAFLHREPVVPLPPDAPADVVRGRYLVEGPGHCGECHSPRNLAGGTDYGRWLAGAASPDGEGSVPNITGGDGGIGDWSAAEIADALETGFKPDFDSFGGAMAEVVRNTARLPAEDRAAIAAYLKAVPDRPSAAPSR